MKNYFLCFVMILSLLTAVCGCSSDLSPQQETTVIPDNSIQGTEQEPNEQPEHQGEKEPPVIETPEVIPPETEQPETVPPIVEPPETEPPEIVPPEVIPPIVEPPETEPPEIVPPVVEPAEKEPPVIETPEVEPPETEPARSYTADSAAE